MSGAASLENGASEEKRAAAVSAAGRPGGVGEVGIHRSRSRSTGGLGSWMSHPPYLPLGWEGPEQ